VRTHDNGVTTVANVTHEHGTATDQDSNTYVFNYNNEFRVSNTVAHRGVFSGLMIDTFSLAGHGPARLNNGFVAKVTTTDSLLSASSLYTHTEIRSTSRLARPTAIRCRASSHDYRTHRQLLLSMRSVKP
jgi:hypothetical protein